MKYTPEQRRAVNCRDRDLLVSAAAGSGKTRVLVGRVLSRIEHERRSLDDFLIITFTRAAAAELRERLLSELGRLAAEQPDNLHLRRQLSLSASGITTIDGLCSNLLREFSHFTGLGDFRIVEGAQAETMLQRAVKNALERVYSSESANVRAFVENFPSTSGDRSIEAALVAMYREWRCHPFPDEWARDTLSLYDCACGFADSVYGKALTASALTITRSGVISLNKLLSLIDDEPLLDGYREAAAHDATQASALLEAIERGDLVGAAHTAAAPLPAIGRSKADEWLRKRAQGLRADWKSALGKVQKLLTNPESFDDELRDQRPALAGLLEATRLLDDDFSSLKGAKNVLDFADLGLNTVKLLCNEHVMSALDGRYAEVLVDEYQDTNNLQTFIVERLKSGGNLFMVGDVKQSIYRFRNAKPEIFLSRYRTYERLGDDNAYDNSNPAKVVLSQNFRSRPEVLDAANYYFSRLMRGGAAELEYGDDERLYCGRDDAPDERYNTEFYVVDVPPDNNGDEDEIPPCAIEREAAFVAGRIKQLLDEGFPIPCDGGTRPIRPDDIAVLLRSGKERSYLFEAALGMRGIAASCGVSVDVTAELMLVMSLLRVIDNPYQDVPLVGVMLSPLFGFTPDDLAAIRSATRYGDLYTSVLKAAESSARVADFLASLEHFRDLSERLSPDGLLLSVYAETGVVGLFSALRGGGERQENLNILYTHARKYAAVQTGGLHGFINYMDGVFEHKQFKETALRGDGVTITTVHKSKGLEFPVVFICGLSVKFNLRDTYNNLLIHPTLGAGMKFHDKRNRVLYPTGAWLAVSEQIRAESLAEELRIMYVAMTRAREKLIMTCALPDPAKRIERLLGRPDGDGFFRSAGSPAEWLVPLTARHPSGRILRKLGGDSAFDTHENSRMLVALAEMQSDGGLPIAPLIPTLPDRPDASDTADIESELVRNLAWRYPHPGLAQVPSKLTATALKGLRDDDDEVQIAAPDDIADTEQTLGGERVFVAARRPQFMSERTKLTPAERGIALHLAMQYIDYNNCGDEQAVRHEIERLRDGRFLTDAQSEAAMDGAAKIAAFFASDTGIRLRRADMVRREFRFSLLDNAERYFPQLAGGSERQVLLQGVCDLFFVENGKIIVVDFKSDYVTQSTAATRAAEYRPQLDAYGRALERVFGMQVGERVLYFLAPGCAISV